MTSFRRVAFPLGFVAILGGALFFSLSTAQGQPGNMAAGNAAVGSGMSPMSPDPAAAAMGAGATGAGAAGATADTGSPTFAQTTGSSPVQLQRKQSFVVLGGTGNENSYDLQNENVYALLREDGTPIPNVLHPYSTAKPSFVLERLIVYSLTAGGNSSGGTGEGTASSPSSSSREGSGEMGGATTQAPAGPSDAEKTIRDVRRVVEAELSRGTGRLGGAHRRKLQLLSNAIASLEAANRVGSAVNQALGGTTGESGGSDAGGTGTSSKLDPREVFYGRARIVSRQADQFTPHIP